MLATVRRKLGTAMQLPMVTLVWLPAAWLLTGLFRGLILTVPTRRLARLYGRDMGTETPRVTLDRAKAQRAAQVGRAIGIAARYAPWDANCYAQALTARTMLRCHGIPHVLTFGVRRTGQGMVAHAWVTAGPIGVCGTRGVERYTAVRVFGGV